MTKIWMGAKNYKRLKKSTSFSTEAMDSVFMSNLIHVVESPTTLLQECYRILRKDGTLVILSITDHGMILREKIKLGRGKSCRTVQRLRWQR